MSVSYPLVLASCPRLGDDALSGDILADEDVGDRLLRIYFELVDLEAGDDIFNKVCAASSSLATSLPFPTTCWICDVLSDTGSLMLTPLTGGTGGMYASFKLSAVAI